MTSIRPTAIRTPRPVAARAAQAPAAKTTPAPLQKHVMFFDGNQDGVIRVGETRKGLKALGLGGIQAALSAVVIHLGLSKTWDGFLKISVDRIAQGKHDSDTDAFDEKGHVDQARVAKIMDYDKNGSGSVSASELSTMIAANKETFAGQLASKAEFGLLVKLGADTTEVEAGKSVPALSQAQLASLYDGTLFYRIAESRKSD